ncbi:bifunctional diguanylate cyclase/phosphodiesterase [Marinilactibacillus psychrotolerans]|uniref:EAL domain-containing protein n=1 Tax=Marinilactibacillus psychrotolerans TaxID=191770 RepID=A0A5R9C7T3_9LACT|nr:GGDEF and EAL domain-containing protein [Marinilactibacillus psychrotolerans]TLQ09337.1 EAL domain-containing protein [Marinilactibacillus psychrotolerans]
MSIFSIKFVVAHISGIVYYSWLIFLGVGFIGMLMYFNRNLNENKSEISTIKKEKKDLESVFNNDRSFLWEIDKNKRNLKASKAVCKILNIDEFDYPNLIDSWKSSVYPDDLPDFLKFIDELDNRNGKSLEVRVYDGKCRIIWLETFVNVVFDDYGQVLKYVGTSIDITTRKLKEEKLRKNNHYDQLTNLPNRKKFYEYFTKQKKEKSDDIEMSIIILDIDRFKIINELHGRNLGDQVLIKVASKLQDTLGNDAFIARESEDEFMILLESSNEKKTKLIAEKLLNVFKKPIKINDQLFYLTISMGISRYPETAQDIDALYQQAEIAMYKVKDSGKSNYHVFMTDDAALIERKRRIEFGLKEALSRNELYLLYQPKVNLSTGVIYGTEALIRWKHPLLGEVSPAEFIPIAEESRIIQDIGYWVMFEAIRQNKIWHNNGICLDIAVNVSVLQYEDPFFIERIKQTLLHHDLDPKFLIIEVTESVMQNIDHSNRIIKELHDLGVKIAIDDFGTGYSSLSVLNNIFIDIVKIDKSFIDGILTKENTASLVKTIIQMGKSLNFHIVAEGIETEDQAEFLKVNECSYGQGYLFSKPLLPKDLPKKIT